MSKVKIIAEIGINHNGSELLAENLMTTAFKAGCDYVKFQKRTPSICVPEHQKERLRETPWGEMSYLQYKEHIEFGTREYEKINTFAKGKWFASVWDIPSMDFIAGYDVPYIKIASACITNHELLRLVNDYKTPVIISTGMSDLDTINHALCCFTHDNITLMHTTSSYPCPELEINLNAIETLKRTYGLPVGYSGHEKGLQCTIAAVALGACMVERHITMDRTMWGTDHSASLEPQGVEKMVRDIRLVEAAMGNGKKEIMPSEVAVMEKLRK